MSFTSCESDFGVLHVLVVTIVVVSLLRGVEAILVEVVSYLTSCQSNSGKQASLQVARLRSGGVHLLGLC